MSSLALAGSCRHSEGRELLCAGWQADDLAASEDSSHQEEPPPKRPRITRGDLVPVQGKDAAADAGLLLQIGICSAKRVGQEVLEVLSKAVTGNEPLWGPVIHFGLTPADRLWCLVV